MAVNALATVSGISPSTTYSMLNEKSKNLGVVALKKNCDGLEISIRDLLIAKFLIFWNNKVQSSIF